MISSVTCWVLRDSRGREAFVSQRIDDGNRSRWQAAGWTIFGPYELLMDDGIEPIAILDAQPIDTIPSPPPSAHGCYEPEAEDMEDT